MFEEEEEEQETDVPKIRTVRPVSVRRREPEEEDGVSVVEADAAAKDREQENSDAQDQAQNREEETGSAFMLEKSLRKAALGTQVPADETKLGTAEEELLFSVAEEEPPFSAAEEESPFSAAEEELPFLAAEEELSFPIKDLAESILKPLEQVLMREAVVSMGMELRPESGAELLQEMAGIRAAKNGGEVQKLYSRVNAAWMREGSSSERSMTVRVDEPAAAHGMTLKEIDRAVSRDARRYDGGMNLL